MLLFKTIDIEYNKRRSKHRYSKPKCHNLHNVQLNFVSVQRTAQTSFRNFLQSRIMVDGDKKKKKINSHDSGGHF